MVKLLEISLPFRAMNTDVEVILCVPVDREVIGHRALERTRLLFAKVEKNLSRFHPESELSRLNASNGSSFKASPSLFEVVRISLEAARATDGVFDPTILPGLIVAGYDQSFEKLSNCSTIPRLKTLQEGSRWQDILLDPKSSSIIMPKGCLIDLGGIGKGWTVDRACDGLEFYSNYAVDAGGDIRVKGRQANGLLWTIGVADPFVSGNNLAIVELSNGAVCTSATSRRKWESQGRLQHHIIDPRTFKPSRSGVVSATIVADSAAKAVILSKVAIILGPEAGLKFIESHPGATGLLVLQNGEIIRSADFRGDVIHCVSYW